MTKVAIIGAGKGGRALLEMFAGDPTVTILGAADGYGNALSTMRTAQEFVKTGVAGVHLAGKTVVSRDEAIGKYEAALAERDRLDREFAIIDAGVDLVWSKLSNSDRGPAIQFTRAMKQTHPKLPLAFNDSSSFGWLKDPNPLTFRELGELGYKFIFMTLYGAHAAMYSVWDAMHELTKNEEQAQWALERTKAGTRPRATPSWPGLPISRGWSGATIQARTSVSRARTASARPRRTRSGCSHGRRPRAAWMTRHPRTAAAAATTSPSVTCSTLPTIWRSGST